MTGARRTWIFCGALLVMGSGCFRVPAGKPVDVLNITSERNPWEGYRAKDAKGATSVGSPQPQAAAPSSGTLSRRAPRLAVMNIEDRSGTVRTRVLGDLTEYLRARLTATGKFLVIDRSRQAEKIAQIMKAEKANSYRECYSKQCQIPLGQALSADSILRANISKIGNTYALSIEVVDLAKEVTVAGAVAECPASPKKGLDQRLLDAVRAIVKDLVSR